MNVRKATSFEEMHVGYPIDNLAALLLERRNAAVEERNALTEEMDRVRPDYEAWSLRDETGYPLRAPRNENAENADVHYRNAPRYLSAILGLGFKRQDVTLAILQNAQEDKSLAGWIKRKASDRIFRIIKADYSQRNEKRDDLDKAYDRSVFAFYKLNNKTAAQRATDIATLDQLILQTNGLNREFSAYPNMDHIVYFYKTLPLETIKSPDILNMVIGDSLVFEVQQERHLRSRIAKEYLDFVEQDANAKADPEYLEQVCSIMNLTRTGRYALETQKKYGTEILFADLLDDSLKGAGAAYDIQDRKIRANRHKSIDTEVQASQVIHELNHTNDHNEFHELFSDQLNIIDQYVAIKLREMKSYAVWQMFMLERGSQTGQITNSVEEISSDQKIQVTDQEIYTRLGIQNTTDSKPSQRLWTPYQANFLSQSLSILSGNNRWGEIWPAYEYRFQETELFDIIKSGEFEKKVAASQFLQPDFLKRFCVAPDGESFLPANPQPVINEIVRAVSTLHHPYLAKLAQTAREAHGIQSPARETVVDRQGPNAENRPKVN